MSKTIDSNLKTITLSFKGFFKDLETIAANIAALNKSRQDMEATGNYTAAYIDDVMKKEEANKLVAINGAINTIIAGVEDFTEAAFNILNASDVLEDTRIAPALASVGSLKGREGAAAAEIIARQFAGNFPVLNLLAASAPDASAKDVLRKHSIDAEGVEAMGDNIGSDALAINNTSDITEISTRVYKLAKVLKSDALAFGVNINMEDFKALSALLEAKKLEDVRQAMGL